MYIYYYCYCCYHYHHHHYYYYYYYYYYYCCSYESDLPPPGLTVSQYKQIVSDKPVDPNTLEKVYTCNFILLCS